MTVAEIQSQIFEHTGIKTSVSNLTGSMRGHIRFKPIKPRGKSGYDTPKYDVKAMQFLIDMLPKNSFISWFDLDVRIDKLTDLTPLKWAEFDHFKTQ